MRNEGDQLHGCLRLGSAWSAWRNGLACCTVVVQLEGIIDKYLGNILGKNLVSYLPYFSE